MAEKLFPARQRCKKCQKGLGLKREDPVYLGLFCNTKCAGVAALATTPGAAPRECVTTRDGQTVWKRRYRSESEVPDKIMNDPSTGLYTCAHCHHLHVGHTRIGTPEQFRMFRGQDDLRDALIKRRGAASVADVAKAAGVRPIRLKELEAGTAHPEGLKTLFAVCQVLRIDIGFALRPLR